MLTAAGADPAEADRLIPVIERTCNVRTPGAWWRAVAAAGDGRQVLDAGRKALANPGRFDRPPAGSPYRNQPDQDYLSWADAGSEAAA
ncbi:hypothetical protein [Micromonospora costi]|uniref:Uncharacterized protein n=1 Tax=Micromonospora costi TaxID=1530042 RepID=A0A3B0A6L5_9ACTN|nr:hypothetical protein [Micromonospora costi]RKN56009.1 hypothetical protein D7193_15605 [Micromonospora costi]